MIYLLTTIHVIVCLFLVIVVLLQSGKAADLAGAFGGMGSQTAFGPRGAATVLSKATTIAAALFMVTSLTLSIAATRVGRTGSTVLERSGPPTAPKTKGDEKKQPASVPIQVQTPGGSQTINVPATDPGKQSPSPAPSQAPAAPPAKK